MSGGADSRIRWLWMLVVAAAACGVAEAVLMRQSGVPLLSVAAVRNAFPTINVATVVGVLVGAVILSRHPRHPIGWLFCWGQLGVAIGLLSRAVSDGISRGGLRVPPEIRPVADLMANLLGSMLALVLLGCLLLLVPDGRLPSRRWLPVLLLLLVSYLVVAVSLLLQFAQQGSTSPRTVVGTADLLHSGGEIGVIVGLVAAAAALLVRLWRSSGETRQQLRWITVAAGFLAAGPLIAVTLNLAGSPTPFWVLILLHIGYLGVPLATGLAVLRYRLYEVDRIVGGSVVLAVLVVMTAAAYVLALGLTGVLARGAHWTTWSSLVVFTAVGLAFQPLRGPVRRLADRVVHGRQSMSYEALHAFTHRLAGSATAEPFLDGVAHAASLLVGAGGCRAVLALEDGTEQSATWPLTSSQTTGATLPVLRSMPAAAWRVPVVHGKQTVGRLELDLAQVAVGSARRQEMLVAFAQRMAGGFDHARREASLRTQAARLERMSWELTRSRAQLLAAKDLGRRWVAGRIKQEVVDRLSPVPGSLRRVADLAAAKDVRSAMGEVESSVHAVTVAIEQLRRITSTVYSRRLSEQGLSAALGAELWPDVTLRVLGSGPRWPGPVESVLYACCLDLIQTLRGPVTVQLSSVGVAQVSLRCAAMPTAQDWLSSTHERISLLGGDVERQPPDGLVFRLPLMDIDQPSPVPDDPMPTPARVVSRAPEPGS